MDGGDPDDRIEVGARLTRGPPRHEHGSANEKESYEGGDPKGRGAVNRWLVEERPERRQYSGGRRQNDQAIGRREARADTKRPAAVFQCGAAHDGRGHGAHGAGGQGVDGGGLLYPLIGLPPSPIIAAAAMSPSSVSVAGNALRLRRARL